MKEPPMTMISGFEIRTDLRYALDSHLWVQVLEGRARVGMDPLGVETSGTLAQVAFTPAGAPVARGEAVGSIEAEKFVGPIVAAVSGVVVAVNSAVLGDPGLIERDPYGEGWLYELDGCDADEMAALLMGEEAVTAAFEKKIRHYRLEGVLAE
jgi:glycine cleavage system H protein